MQYFKKCFNERELVMINEKKDELWFKDYVCSQENKMILGEEVLLFLFKYITKKLEIKWNGSSLSTFTTQISIYDRTEPFDEIDIIDLDLKVKHIPLSHFSTGKYKEIISSSNKREVEQALIYQSVESFLSALSSDPGNHSFLKNIAFCYQRLDKRHFAVSYYQRALLKNPLSSSTNFKFAIFLDQQFSNTEADNYYIKSLQSSPLKYSYLVTFADRVLFFLFFYFFFIFLDSL
jgi:tetratricopeptide (TPR) repeat protein